MLVKVLRRYNTTLIDYHHSRRQPSEHSAGSRSKRQRRFNAIVVCLLGVDALQLGGDLNSPVVERTNEGVMTVSGLVVCQGAPLFTPTRAAFFSSDELRLANSLPCWCTRKLAEVEPRFSPRSAHSSFLGGFRGFAPPSTGDAAVLIQQLPGTRVSQARFQQGVER